MFCTNCGKEIIDTARFCNFCGMPVRNMAASVPVQPIQPVRQSAAEPVVEQPAPANSESGDIPSEENVSESISGDSVADARKYAAESTVGTALETDPDTAENESLTSVTINAAIPTPNTIPTQGTSTPAYSVPPVYPAQSVNSVPAQPPADAAEKKPERRYTLGHIMMCLAAVAVMAIVAGVFAGLYFSVV